MKTNLHCFATTFVRLVACLGLAGCIAFTRAQVPAVSEAFERTGRAEVYGIGQYLHSEDVDFDGPAGVVSMGMDDTGLGGIGFGYHINPFLSLRAEFMFGGATLEGDLPTDLGGTLHIAQDAFMHTGRLNLDYNILNRRLTPFVTAGIGYQYLETELERLPPVEYCWWDPWWGWVCDVDEPYASETVFTWNAGVGIRWDISDNVFIKAMAGANWLQYDSASSITTQIEGVFCVGWSF